MAQADGEEGATEKNGAEPEESELYLESKDMAAALESDSDTGDGDEKMVVDQAEEEFKELPDKATKKKATKKEKNANPKPAAKDDGAVGGNKHAKQVTAKVMMNEKEAKTAVADYMQSQNRPYSIQNVMDNLHGRIPRKICQQVLDDLTAEKHLVCKEFGKAKVYIAN